MAEKYKKTNEAWFGDSFNRDALTCSYSAINDVVNSITCGAVTAANCATGSDYTVAKGTREANCYTDVVAIDRIDTLSDQLQKIQEQIDGLKKSLETKKSDNKLRLALKTLNYTRELE
jgi:uncharacterized protein (DUF342 family)